MVTLTSPSITVTVLGSPTTSTETMSGLTGGAAVDGDHASISVALPVGVTSWTFQAWGVGSYGDETYGNGANPTDYGASVGSNLLWQGVGDDGNLYQASAEIAPVAATGGVNLDLSFIEGTPIGPVDLTQNWTLNGNVLSFVSVSPALPTSGSIDSDGNLNISSPAVTADATYTLTMEDQIGRQTSDTFTLEVTAITAAPTLNSVTFTDNNDGTPASLAIGYTGDVTGYRVYIATGDGTLSVTAAQLYAGTGGTGTLEFTDFAIGTNIDVTGLTSTSESATQVAVALIKSADGSGATSVINETVSGLDFTAPTFSSGSPADNATGVAVGATPALTFSENIFGVSGKDFYLYDNIDTTPVLVETFTFTSTTAATGDNGGSASISGAVITLTPGVDMDASTQHSVRWEAGAVTDADGNDVAANTGDTTYNFTTAAGGGSLTLTHRGYDGSVSNATSYTFSSKTLGTGRIVVVVSNQDGDAPTGVTVGGNAASLVTDGTTTASHDGFSNNRVSAWIYDNASASGDIVVTFATAASNCYISWYLVENFTAVDTVVINRAPFNTAAPWSVDFSLATSSGGIVIAAYSCFNFTCDLDNVSGVTIDGTLQTTEAGNWATYSATGAAAETRSVSIGDDTTTANRSCGVAMAIS